MIYLVLGLGLFVIFCQAFLLHGNPVIGISAMIGVVTLTGVYLFLKRSGKKRWKDHWVIGLLILILAIVAPCLAMEENTFLKKCEKVENLIDEGECDKAEELMQELKEEYRENDFLYLLSAKNYLKQENYREALKECERVKNKEQEYYFMKGQIFSRNPEISVEMALRFYEEGAAKFPEWEYIQVMSGEYALKLKKYNKAEHYLFNVLSLNDENPFAYFYLGMNYYAQQEYDKALDCFIKSTDCGANEEMNGMMHDCAVEMQKKTQGSF